MALHSDDTTRAALLAAGALLVASAGVLAGCMQQRTPAPPGQADQLQPGMGFFLDRNEDEGWKLAYGQENTDNVQLMLECKPGSRKIDIFDMGHSNARKGGILILASGKVQSALMAGVQPDEASSQGVVVVAHTTPDLPALDGFRRTGSLAVKLGAHEYALSASPAEKSRIARFFRGCERQ